MSQAQTPAVDPRLDLAVALRDVPSAELIVTGADELGGASLAAEANAAALSIESAADAERAAEMAAAIRKAKNEADEKRKRLKKPWSQVVEGIDGVFGVVIRRFDGALSLVQNKGAAWLQKEEERRRAEERRVKAEQEERDRAAKAAADEVARIASERALEEAKAAGFTEKEAVEYATVQAREAAAAVPAPLPVITRIIPQTTLIKSASGSLGTRADWDFEVLDLAAFVKAHPGCVSVNRGDTKALIRGLAAGLGEDKVPTVAGLKVTKVKTGTSRSR